MTTPSSSRRDLLRATSALGLAALSGSATGAHASDEKSTPAIEHGRIKQSIVQWCFNDHWDIPRTIQVARQLGCGSIELIDAKHYPALKENGLECAIASTGIGFQKGFNNPEHRDEIVTATRNAIDACVPFGFKKVIAFTGMSDGMTQEEGADNCVEGFKQIVGHAEKQGVTICLEMLNTRDSSHPMKGHPGYQGDHTEYCVDIINRVGSPALKLLFDIYHVQIMDGDIIRRIHQHKDVIGHIHTAGNPGRAELDDNQEINYPPIMRALLEIGYDGYVGQEFIPTRDPLASLTQAVKLCDV